MDDLNENKNRTANKKMATEPVNCFYWAFVLKVGSIDNIPTVSGNSDKTLSKRKSLFFIWLSFKNVITL